MNKKIIILSIIAIIIVVGGGILFWNLKNKGNGTINTKIKVDDIKEDSSVTLQGNYNTIPYSEESVTSSNDSSTTEERKQITANPNGEVSQESNAQLPMNSPEVTGILDPILEFKPLDVENSDEESTAVRINITKPTYILFIDLTNEESTKMLTVVNNLSMSYSDVVDFVAISNLSGSKEDIKNYFTTHGISIPLFFDDDENNSPIKNYNIQSLPHTLIIDKFGNIVNSISGLKEADTIAANLDIISENFD